MSAASAWKRITTSPTFADLEASPANRAVFKLLTNGLDDKSDQAAPDINNLKHVSGRNTQRAFTAVLLRNKFVKLVNNESLSLEVRHRIQQATLTGAGRFQACIPDATGELDLDNGQYLINYWYRYGLTQHELKGKRCVNKCPSHGALGGAIDENGAHCLGCIVNHRITVRHDAFLGWGERCAKTALPQ